MEIKNRYLFFIILVLIFYGSVQLSVSVDWNRPYNITNTYISYGGGGADPIWINTTSHIYLNQSYAQDVNISGQINASWFYGNASKLYDVNYTRGATIIVAASDSREQKADYTCDGSADDATIESAINALPTKGGRVLLLDGNYSLSSTIDITRDFVVLEGQGFGTVLNYTGTLAHGIRLYRTNNVAVRNLHIYNSTPAYSGIYLDLLEAGVNNKNNIIEGNYIESFQDGIYYDGGWYCRISGNYIKNSTRYGIFLDNHGWTYVTDNFIINAGDIAIREQHSNVQIIGNIIRCDSGKTTTTGIYAGTDEQDIMLRGNDIDYCAKGIDIANVQRVGIIGNRVLTAHSGDAITVDFGTTIIISNNEILSAEYHGMELTDVKNSIISTNYINADKSDTDNYDGIRFIDSTNPCQYNVIQGNRIDNGGWGINLTTCDNNTVMGNVLIGATDGVTGCGANDNICFNNIVASSFLAYTGERFEFVQDNALFLKLNGSYTNITSGDFMVDVDTLFVDESLDRVGIGTSSPSYTFDVSGLIYSSENITANEYFIGNGSLLTNIDCTQIGNGSDVDYCADSTYNSSYLLKSGGNMSGPLSIVVDDDYALEINSSSDRMFWADTNANVLYIDFGMVYSGTAQSEPILVNTHWAPNFAYSSCDLGGNDAVTGTGRWRDLYLSRYLTDNTNQITIAQMNETYDFVTNKTFHKYVDTMFYTNITVCPEGKILKISGGAWTCQADDTGGAGGVNYWQSSGNWMFPNVTAGGKTSVNLTNLNVSEDLNVSGEVYINDTKVEAHREWGWADEQTWTKHIFLPLTHNTSLGGWTKYTNNPVLNGTGGVGDFDRYGATYPMIIKHNDVYYMFYTGQKGTSWPLTCGGIGVATSPNGTEFNRSASAGNPIIDLGAGGSWDDYAIGLSTVIYDDYETDANKRWKMWYTGYSDATTKSIGYAYAATPTGTWTKYANNPVYTPSNFDVGCSVLRFGNIFYMAYVEAGTPNVIRAAVSNNGTTWYRWGTILSPSGSGWDDRKLGYVSVFWNLGVWYVLYSGQATADNVYQIGLATSYSGFRTYDKWPFNPVLGPSASGWDDKWVLWPNLIMEENQFWLYYSAYDTATPQHRNSGLAKIP